MVNGRKSRVWPLPLAHSQFARPSSHPALLLIWTSLIFPFLFTILLGDDVIQSWNHLHSWLWWSLTVCILTHAQSCQAYFDPVALHQFHLIGISLSHWPVKEAVIDVLNPDRATFANKTWGAKSWQPFSCNTRQSFPPPLSLQTVFHQKVIPVHLNWDENSSLKTYPALIGALEVMSKLSSTLLPL